jgi:hypothetical protein
MTIFDQRGQIVNYQYNVNGEINFASVQNRFEVVDELKKLQAEIISAGEAGALQAETSVDLEALLKKAIIQAQKPEPEKKSILSYLDNAKLLIEGAVDTAGLLTGISDAIEAVKGYF